MSYYKTDKGILFEEVDYIVNPREDMDYFTTFLTFSSRKYSPDENEFKNYAEMAIHFAGDKCDEIYRKEGLVNGNDYLIEKMEAKGYIALPVYKYEHSGISYSAAMRNPFGCPFDSGLIGIIYASKEDIKKEYSVSRVTKKIKEKVLELMKSEVEYYSDWANGDVFYYQLLNEEDGEEIDGCGGFVGSIDINGIQDAFEFSEYTYIGESWKPENE